MGVGCCAIFAVVAFDFADLHHLGEATRIRQDSAGEKKEMRWEGRSAASLNEIFSIILRLLF